MSRPEQGTSSQDNFELTARESAEDLRGDLIRLDRVCSDRVVRVHNEGAPDQRLETLDRTEYFIAVSAVESTVETVELPDEEAAA